MAKKTTNKGYNEESKKNLINNPENTKTEEEKKQIQKKASENKIKSFKWSGVIELPKDINELPADNKIIQDWALKHIYSKFNLLRSKFGYDYYFMFHDADIKEDGTKKRTHLHFVIIDNFYELKTTKKSMLKFLSNLFDIDANAITLEALYRKEMAIKYLTHCEDADKAQYDFKKILTNRVAERNRIFKDFEIMKNDTNALVDSLDSKNLDFLIYESRATLRDLLKIVSLRWIKANLNLINNLIKDAKEAQERSELACVRISKPKSQQKDTTKYMGFKNTCIVGAGPALNK